MCGLKSSLAFVKPSPLFLRNCSQLCPKDEGPGEPGGPDTGAGERVGAGWGQGWVGARGPAHAFRGTDELLMNLIESDYPKLKVVVGGWGGGGQ